MTFRLLAVLALCACSSGNKKRHLTPEQMITADPLPLAKGAKWTYTVTTKKFDPDTNKETTKTLEWTTEVLDEKAGNGVIAYRVKGWPEDLADFEFDGGGPRATERTLLRSGNSFMFGAPSAAGEPTVEGAEGWFSWPVHDGQKICPKADMVYCWKVTAVETGYSLLFYTGPDEKTFELEPGTGVARFHYAHHGTTNEVEAKLKSYEKPSR